MLGFCAYNDRLLFVKVVIDKSFNRLLDDACQFDACLFAHRDEDVSACVCKASCNAYRISVSIICLQRPVDEVLEVCVHKVLDVGVVVV